MSDQVGAFENGVRKTENVLSLIGVVLFLVVMFVGAFDVIGRYIFNRPISGASEIAQMSMVGVVLFFAAYTQAKKGHIMVEILYSHYPPRARAIIGFVILFLALAIFALIAWQSAVIAGADLQEHRISSVIHIPFAPVRLLVSVGAFVICLDFIVDMIRLVPQLKGKKEN